MESNKVEEAVEKEKVRPQYRGKKIVLPSNFLELPASAKQQNVLMDEELATYLQDEMFRREVGRVLGDRSLPPGQSVNSNRNSQSQSQAQAQRRPSQQKSDDLGILKSLSSMGSAAKRNLSNLALRFKKDSSKANTGDSQIIGQNSFGEDDPFLEHSSSNDSNDGEDTVLFNNPKPVSISNNNLDEDEEKHSTNPLMRRASKSDV